MTYIVLKAPLNSNQPTLAVVSLIRRSNNNFSTVLVMDQQGHPASTSANCTISTSQSISVEIVCVHHLTQMNSENGC